MIAIDLEGKTAVVTGASRGIGKAVALGLADAGADIIAVSGSGPGPELESEVRQRGRYYEAYSVDLLDRSAVERFGSQIAEHAQVDILVNNAGILRRSPAESHASKSWYDVVEANLNAQFVLSREIGSSMLARQHGRIIFMASILGFRAGMDIPAYTASKSGLIGLMRALANEWADQGVNVNAVAPGYIETDMNKDTRQDTTYQRRITEGIPAARWGTPEDIAGPVVFLASKLAEYVHGAVVAVDGGWLVR